MEIAGFFGKYYFLSNFYPFPIYLEGYWWPTNEHYFQWCKAAPDEQEYWAEQILKKPEPKWAKHIGCWKMPKPVDWEYRKLDVMYKGLTIKFQDDYLERLLLDTYPKILVEENSWKDIYWGRCNGIGDNHLGILLMKVRDYIMSYREDFYLYPEWESFQQ